VIVAVKLEHVRYFDLSPSAIALHAWHHLFCNITTLIRIVTKVEARGVNVTLNAKPWNRSYLPRINPLDFAHPPLNPLF
jgi:hypothetical protein